MLSSEQKPPPLTWPDAEAPSDRDMSLGGLNINGTQYKKAEVSPGKWQWVRDDEANASLARMEQSRRELYWALRSRVLTDDEMARVANYGEMLNIEPMVGYRAEEKAKELNDALLQQFRLRAAARDAK